MITVTQSLLCWKPFLLVGRSLRGWILYELTDNILLKHDKNEYPDLV